MRKEKKGVLRSFERRYAGIYGSPLLPTLSALFYHARSVLVDVNFNMCASKARLHACLPPVEYGTIEENEKARACASFAFLTHRAAIICRGLRFRTGG